MALVVETSRIPHRSHRVKGVERFDLEGGNTVVLAGDIFRIIGRSGEHHDEYTIPPGYEKEFTSPKGRIKVRRV